MMITWTTLRSIFPLALASSIIIHGPKTVVVQRGARWLQSMMSVRSNWNEPQSRLKRHRFVAQHAGGPRTLTPIILYVRFSEP